MIPQPEFFQQYFRYVEWADQRQLAEVAKLPEAEYRQDRGFSFGSMIRILQHELAAQSVWVDRFEGVPSVWRMDDPELGTLAGIQAHWPQAHARVEKFLADLTPDRLSGNLHYTNLAGKEFDLPLWSAIFHMCQHSYYHRSQLNSMIQLAGGTPVSTDFSLYSAECNK